MAADKTHSLPAEKEGGRWRAGEPVDIFEDTGGPRKTDGSPVFNTIYVNAYAGTLVDAKDELLGAHYQDDDIEKALVAQRKIVMDQLTVSQQSNQDKNGFITLSAAQMTASRRTRPPNELGAR